MISELGVDGGLQWTELSEPTPEELAAFVREAELTPADAEFVVQNHHRPEVTIRDSYIIVLTHVPVFYREQRVTTGVPLFFVIKEGRLWTIHFEDVVVLDRLLEEYKDNQEKREEFFHEGAAALALRIISEMYESAFHKIGRLAKHINIAEDAVFQGNERKMVVEISVLMRDVMDFRKVMRPQRRLFAVIPTHPLVTVELVNQWQRIHNQIYKMWELLTSLFESMKELRDTNDSLLQHKENELLRLLTYYSTVSIPFLLLLTPLNPFTPDASAFEVTAFWITLGILTALLALIFARFKWRRIV